MEPVIGGAKTQRGAENISAPRARLFGPAGQKFFLGG
jgi:hypothetical protein